MNKFEEELSSLPVSKSTNYAEYWNKAQLLTVFKDWQPQQALPVVPEDVAEWISEDIENNTVVEDILTIIITSDDKDLKEYGLWIKKNPVTYVIARTLGYTVEKPQLFYLKNKLTGAYLYYDEATKLYSDIVGNVEDFFGTKTKFTQQEIDSMQTGSYELVPVEDVE
ncbi:DUF1642 domain-containing protein [Lactococcus lactis]|uniref:DUF1642 domain-containing protein n=1 Tax=Lactococcus lactis TaxID=1358 RepID=UPI00321A1A0E